jgi:hypothetical protein
MTAVAARGTGRPAGTPEARSVRRHFSAALPTIVATIDAIAFLVIRPDVGDLQAALGREMAAAQGVGLWYWFGWFSGGTTPGHYSILSPWLTSWIGAAPALALATVITTPLAAKALAGTRYATLGVWVATFTAACNMWSGRVPFALGCAAAVGAVVAIRSGRMLPTIALAVLSVLFSPVSGALLAMVLAMTVLVERGRRRLQLAAVIAAGGCLVAELLIFGSPGPQGFSLGAALITSWTLLWFLFARPARALRPVIIASAALAPVLSLIPNGMGSNFPRLAWICLPAVVAATASTRRLVAVFAIAPALVCCAEATAVDLVRAHQPTAQHAFYASLDKELDSLKIVNYRLEAVVDNNIHTAADALITHVALARGYETQEDNALNAVLLSKTALNPVSYRRWLDENAVGYIAISKVLKNPTFEAQLINSGQLGYLTQIWTDPDWNLYRVSAATPIVPAPETLVSASQSQMIIDVPCTCRFGLRVRYSKFLAATIPNTTVAATVADDGTGWTVVTTPQAGRYVLQGSPTGLFR